jgi:hypothetical protein
MTVYYDYDKDPDIEIPDEDLAIREALDQLYAFHPEADSKTRYHAIDFLEAHYTNSSERLNAIRDMLAWYKIQKIAKNGEIRHDPFDVRRNGFEKVVQEYSIFRTLNPIIDEPRPNAVRAILFDNANMDKEPSAERRLFEEFARNHGIGLQDPIQVTRPGTLSIIAPAIKNFDDKPSTPGIVITVSPEIAKIERQGDIRDVQFKKELSAELQGIKASIVKGIHRTERAERIRDVWQSKEAESFRRAILPTIAWAEARKEGAPKPTAKHYDAARETVKKVQASGSLAQRDWDKKVRDIYGPDKMFRAKMDSLREDIKELVNKRRAPKIEESLSEKIKQRPEEPKVEGPKPPKPK